MTTDQLYWRWQEINRQVDLVMEHGGSALDLRFDAAVAKEAYLKARDKELV